MTTYHFPFDPEAKGGRFYARRASDSELQRVNKAAAMHTYTYVPTPASHASMLAIWWVPKELVDQVSDPKPYIAAGWVLPIWDWGRGQLLEVGDNVAAPERNPATEVAGVLVEDWQPLPQKHDDYFLLNVPGTVTVPIDKLIAIRARERGVRNANRFMHMARRGETDKRKPISLRDNDDGTYTVLDGNSTFANAKASGWDSLPGVVVERADDSDNLTINPASGDWLLDRVAGLIADGEVLQYDKLSVGPYQTAMGAMSFAVGRGPKVTQYRTAREAALAFAGLVGRSGVRTAIAPFMFPMGPLGDFGAQLRNPRISEAAFRDALSVYQQLARIEGQLTRDERKAKEAADRIITAYYRQRLRNPLRRNSTGAMIDPTDPKWQRTPITREHYPGIFGNFDGDPFLNADDPDPLTRGDTVSIEEVKLSDELGSMIDMRGELETGREAVQQSLQGIADRIGRGSWAKSRTKTPYSMVQKARKKFLPTLTDMAGGMLIVPDAEAAAEARNTILAEYTGAPLYQALQELAKPQYNGKPPFHAVGRVLEYDDKYAKPQGGYRAYHFLINLGTQANPRIVEVQLKTSRMYAISDAGHTPYKRGVQDAAMMERLTGLAAQADQGDAAAAAEVDPIIARGHDYLVRLLTLPEAR